MLGLNRHIVVPFGVVIIVVLVSIVGGASVEREDGFKYNTKKECEDFLNKFNTEAQENWYKDNIAAWKYETNLTTYNQKVMVDRIMESSMWRKGVTVEALEYNYLKVDDFTITRQFEALVNPGIAILNKKDLKEDARMSSNLEDLYSEAKICPHGLKQGSKGCMSMDPGITKLMAESRNYKELTWAFKAWRDNSGKKMMSNFTDYVRLLNKAAKLNHYEDEGAHWRSWYESSSFEKNMEDLFQELKPLYAELHGFARNRLQKVYAKQGVKFPGEGHIPSHIMGNMWGQTWGYIYDILEPYKNKVALDVTDELIKQKYTELNIVEKAEEFFVSIGLEKMNPNFWNKSMLVRPKGRSVVCHASAWDFYNGKDFRMKLCVKVNMEDLVTVHHEMGHIQYFMNYAKQPVLFRDGANPGFHEAIGDTMALSATTPKHLHAIGLIETLVEDSEVDVNFLMTQALEKLAFLPFGYMIDKFRWNVFSGATRESQYTKHWWDLRCKYQGISPPITRYRDDFDPGAKYHIAAFMPYIRYFVSHILQFTFQKSLCKESGHKGPLYKCDIFNSKKAGNKLKKMLQLGSSKPWPLVMEEMTGNPKLTADALVEYFGPLLKFLRDDNKKNNIKIGWSEACPKNYYKDTVTPKTVKPVTQKPRHNSAMSTLTCFILIVISSIISFISTR